MEEKLHLNFVKVSLQHSSQQLNSIDLHCLLISESDSWNEIYV